jgi:hypothetical protein
MESQREKRSTGTLHPLQRLKRVGGDAGEMGEVQV